MAELTCTHFDQISVTELPASIAGCEECLKIGARWVHLRMCTSCGKITEFEDERIEALQRAVAERQGFELTSHKMELYGLCARCRRKERG